MAIVEAIFTSAFMKRGGIALVALILLVLVGWFALRDDGRTGPVATRTAVQPTPDENLPDTPSEWRGRIDYRALDQQITALMTRPEMTGLAVAVVEDGRLSFVRSYGLANIESGAPVTPQTLFRWASVSKTATGAMAATLASDGALNLGSPVGDWRTTLRLPGDAQYRITVANLLSQRTGLTKNAYDDKLEAGQQAELLRASFVAAPLQCHPGTCHTYQNVAFDAAGEIIGQATRQYFPDAVKERLFVPLGMDSATYGMAELTESVDWARPYRDGQPRPLIDAYWRVPAAAGVESNIVDFATWMKAMMGLRADVISPATLEIAHRPRVNTERLYGGTLRQAINDASYGLGWRSFTYDGHRLEGHSGAVSGYRATMIFEPATRTGVVALWNSDWGFPFRIPFVALDSYHKREGTNWLDLSTIPPKADGGAAESDLVTPDPSMATAGSR